MTRTVANSSRTVELALPIRDARRSGPFKPRSFEDELDLSCAATHTGDVATIVFGAYEWDDEKAAANLAKHGVSFFEAATALQDPNAAYVGAGEIDGEARVAAIGMSAAARVLLVVHVERSDRDRIVSARIATDAEESIYAGG